MNKTPMIAMIALTLASATAFAADTGEQSEMMAAAKALITPDKAVAIAEQIGGRAYAMGMEVAGSGHWYEVDVLRNGKPVEVRIDSDNGKVLGSSAARGEDANGAHALAQGKLTLGAAIADAERAGSGTAMEATSNGSGSRAAVIVDVVHGNTISHYRESMVGGQIRGVKTAAGAD
ncbi:MAG: PepSY domain-containing protein [Rhodanobacteraceae bacterium]